MKKTILTLLLTATGFIAEASSPDSLKIKFDLLTGPSFNLNQSNFIRRPAFAFWIHLDIPVKANWSFNPGVGYEGIRASQHGTYYDTSGNKEGEHNTATYLHYLTLNGRFKHSFKFDQERELYIHGGPFFSYLVTAIQFIDSYGPTGVDRGDLVYKRFNAGLSLGLGFHKYYKNSSRLSLELRVNPGLMNIDENNDVLLTYETQRTLGLQILAGYGIPIK